MVRARKAPPQMPGNPQHKFPNRTDLAAQPVRVPTGRNYGQATQIAQAQRAVPLPQAQAPQPLPQVNDEQSRLAQAMLDARGIDYDETPFDADSQRPGEPLTAGLSIGAGPGPEVLGLRNNPRAASLLGALAAASGDREMAELARLATIEGV